MKGEEGDFHLARVEIDPPDPWVDDKEILALQEGLKALLSPNGNLGDVMNGGMLPEELDSVTFDRLHRSLYVRTRVHMTINGHRLPRGTEFRMDAYGEIQEMHVPGTRY